MRPAPAPDEERIAVGLARLVLDSPEEPIKSAAVIAPRIAAQTYPPFAATSPPSEPPAIHVTIGRIEIRATPAATSPVRRERTLPPVMTLEEYLEQRAGGGPR